MPIYMNFPGASGSVTTQGYEGWIEVFQLSFGMDRPMESRLGQAGFGATGKLKIHDISVAKPTDGSSPALTIAALQGAFDKTVKLAFTTTTRQGMVNFMSYELRNCGIASASTNGTHEGTPMENYTLSFGQIQFTFNNMDQTGSSQPTITGYNLETAQSL